jgi:hypothetical protein
VKQQFLKSIAGTIRLTAYDKNRSLVPSSAFVALYQNDGSTVIQAEASASVDSTTGEMTYSLTTTHTANKGLNFKAVWRYVSGGNTYYETQLFDVVRSILSIPITDDDLYGELPSLRKSTVQVSGTATSATTSTLVDTVRRKEADDYFKGGIVEIMSGTGSGQSRDITGSTQSTGTISVNPAFATTPDTTSIYRVIRSFTSTIIQCFEKIEQMLYDKGKRDTLILESSQIRVALIYLVIHTIALDLRDEQNDRWDLLAKDYMDKFEKAFNSMTLDYDADESGGVQGEEAQQNVSSLRIQRS